MYKSMLFFAAFATLLPVSLFAQPGRPSAEPSVNLVVTAQPNHGLNPPAVNREDVVVHQGAVLDTVTAWTPAKGDHAGLQLFILIDDASDSSLGLQFGDIRHFINAQPSTTQVGVAYMQNGIARIVQNLTGDHAQAAKSLRLPLGVYGINASPYFSLSDLFKRWPSGSPRREVVMISSGVDRYYGIADTQDPYVMAAIEDAQRDGILVFAIYNPGVGRYGRAFWRHFAGEIFLSQLTDETGGEGYYLGFTGPAVSFAPYLDSINHCLQNQYLLSFVPKPEKKKGMQPIKITTEVPNVDLVSASQVFVPGTP